MLIPLLLSGSALAVPADLACLETDATACAAANQAALLVHNELPDQISAEKSGRFGTLHTFNLFKRLLQVAEDRSCTVDGVLGGKYTNPDWNGFSQPLGDTGFPPTMQGIYDREVRTLLGDFEGGTDNLADLWGRMHKGRFLLNTDGSEQTFIAGSVLRIQGSRGAFVGVVGSCEGPANEAFAGWLGWNLETVRFDTVHPVLNAACGSCHFAGNALGVGGEEIVAVGDPDPVVAFAATQEVCNIGSGVTCGEESVDFILDDHKPSAAAGGPLSPGVKVLFERWLNGGLLDEAP